MILAYPTMVYLQFFSGTDFFSDATSAIDSNCRRKIFLMKNSITADGTKELGSTWASYLKVVKSFSANSR